MADIIWLLCKALIPMFVQSHVSSTFEGFFNAVKTVQLDAFYGMKQVIIHLSRFTQKISSFWWRYFSEKEGLL